MLYLSKVNKKFRFVEGSVEGYIDSQIQIPYNIQFKAMEILHYPVDRITPSLRDTAVWKPEHSDPLPNGEDIHDLLGRYKHVSSSELHRLALLIYGITLPDNFKHRLRRDGVISGIDLLIASKTPDEGEVIDYDGGRLALFQTTRNNTPYSFSDTERVIKFEEEVAIPYAQEYPADQFLGPYYLRTDRMGARSRLVVNPNPNCSAACRWCARTYPERRLNKEQLITDVMPSDDLVHFLINDPNVLQGNNDLSHLSEINLITGDLPRNYPIDAASYFTALIKTARSHEFRGIWYYAGHQIESEQDIERLAQLGGEGVFVYTIEHFTKRRELMPLKGRRDLKQVHGILTNASRYFGKENAQYYYISGIDDPKSTFQGIEYFADIATPQLHVLTPYAVMHEQYYYRDRRLDRVRDLLDLQEFIINFYGKPVPSGSNRALFTPHVKFEQGVVSF